jgi:hypothetical protein
MQKDENITDHVRLSELNKELSDLSFEIERKYAEWLESDKEADN